MKITNTEKMDEFLRLETLNQAVASLAGQAPVPCASCQVGAHKPWWGKHVAPLSHITNEQLKEWSS